MAEVTIKDIAKQLGISPATVSMALNDRAGVNAQTKEKVLKLVKELASDPDATLVDGVNLAVERFESQHPTLTGTLRNILQSLANMGI